METGINARENGRIPGIWMDLISPYLRINVILNRKTKNKDHLSQTGQKHE